jgi:hypothetical protein
VENVIKPGGEPFVRIVPCRFDSQMAFPEKRMKLLESDVLLSL